MKITAFVLIAFLVGLGVGWMLGSRQPTAGPKTGTSQIAQQVPPLAATPTLQATAPTQAQMWQQYQVTRQKVMAARPELAAEYQAIRTEMAGQQKGLQSAMIQADPKVKAILAKFDAMRNQSAPPRPVAAPAH